MQEHAYVCWRYVLRVTEEPDPVVMLIAGDAAHNLRTALDHLAVAIAPADRQQVAAFPILIDDATTNREARERFDRATKGMPDAAIEVIRAYQPYSIGAKLPVQTHGLAIIASLDNADKHRQLIATTSGIIGVQVQTSVRGKVILPEQQPHPPNGLVEDGTDLSHFASVFPDLQESEVPVDVGLDGGEVELTGLRPSLPFFRDELFPRLEPFARP
jgi:hypothetical protein